MKSDPCSVWASLAITLVCLVVSADATSNAPTPPVVPKSGLDYASAEVRALQADDASNPGMLWVAQGEMLWSEVVGAEAKSCAQCHGLAPTSMKAVATRYPQVERRSQLLINLEGRINICRATHQGAPTLPYESAELIALTAYIAHQSRGLARQISITDGNREYFMRGAALYRQRMGQMNLACTHCHDQNAGKTLLATTIDRKSVV